MSGIETHDSYHVPLFVYLGDTTVEPFLRSAELEGKLDQVPMGMYIFDMPFVITEATFLAPEHVEMAKVTGHTHWKDLEPIIKSHPNNTFVITHTSLRYPVDWIVQLLTGPGLKNVVPFLPPNS